MKQRGISIRYKVLFLLTTLPVVALGSYLYIALDIFEKDKVAYVFDANSNLASTIGTQLKTQITNLLSDTRPIFQDYLNQQKFSSVGESLFQNQNSILALNVFSKDATGNFIIDQTLEKEVGVSQNLISKLGPLKDIYLATSSNKNFIFQVPFKNDIGILIQKVSDVKTKRENVFFVFVRMNEISELFSSEGRERMYLVTNDGSILFGPSEVVGTNVSTIFKTKYLDSQSDRSVALGTETVKDTKGNELLISFSKVGVADLSVVSSVPKEAALSAVQLLIQKSLIFFGVLISITVIISLIASNTVTSSLTMLFDATKKVAQGNFDIRVRVNSKDEVGALADNFNLMAGEVARLLEQTAENARMENELKTAKTVQETLFPMTNSTLGDVTVSGHFEPASECGGDWWHYCTIGNKLFFWIGDATGHGVPAALITSAARSAASIIETMEVTPSQAMTLLNRSICEASRGRIMMTFFLACYDSSTGKLSYCNASHEGPYLIRREVQDLKKKDLLALNEVNNPRLGQSLSTVYQETEVDFSSGDSVFFYTDGIPDVQSPEKEPWGEREFIKTLVQSFKDHPQPSIAVSRFVEKMNSYRQGTELIDDVTFFVIQKN